VWTLYKIALSIYYACNYLYNSERFQEEMTTSKKPILQKKIQQHDRGLLPSVADPVRLWGLRENFVGGVSRQVEVVKFKLQ